MQNSHNALPSGVKISLVVATRDASATLADCLKSFYDQDYPNKQLVLIDGASGDDTVAIAKEWCTRGDVIVSEADSGVYDAWNKAIPLCTGEWISFLGADDMLPGRGTYSQIAEYLSRAPVEAEIIYGNVALTNLQGETLLTFGQPWATVMKRHKAGGTLPHPGSMHRKTLFNRIGSFDTSFRIAGDYELQLRALENREPIYMPDVTTALHRLGGISGAENELDAIREVSRARQKNGRRFPSVKLMVNFTYTVLRKTLIKTFGQKKAHSILDSIRGFVGRGTYWTKT